MVHAYNHSTQEAGVGSTVDMACYESPTSSSENEDGSLYLLYMHFIFNLMDIWGCLGPQVLLKVGPWV